MNAQERWEIEGFHLAPALIGVGVGLLVTFIVVWLLPQPSSARSKPTHMSSVVRVVSMPDGVRCYVYDAPRDGGVGISCIEVRQ